jgi:hypothetical protein
VNGVLQEQFSYTLRDGDGDTSTGTLTLRATVNPPPAPDVVEHGLPEEAQPVLVAHGVDPIHGDHDGEVIYGLPYQTQPIVKPSAEYTTKPPIYIKPVDGIKDDAVYTRPPVFEKPVDGVKDDNHHYMDDGTVIYGLPYQTQPVIKPVDTALSDDVIDKPKPEVVVCLGPVDPVEYGLPYEIQPVVRPVDTALSDDVVYTRPPVFEKPVDGVKDDNHHYMDDGTVIYGLPYQTQPVIKPVDGIKPVIKPDAGGDDIFLGPPVEAKPGSDLNDVLIKPREDAFTNTLKILAIKDIVEVQSDDLALYADNGKIDHDLAVELVQDVLAYSQDVLAELGSSVKPFVGDFGVQPIDEEFALPVDVFGVDALQESINAFVVSSTANDNYAGPKDGGAEHQDVAVFASAFRSVSDLGLGDVSEQAVAAQGRV